MTLVYTAELGLVAQKTDVGNPKIDDSALEI